MIDSHIVQMPLFIDDDDDDHDAHDEDGVRSCLDVLDIYPDNNHKFN